MTLRPRDRTHPTNDTPPTDSDRFLATVAADGDWVWLESRTRSLPDDAVGELVINSRDVSERKRRERRLADRNERLDRFASIGSHDLRNPLSVIRASIEMVKHKDDLDPLDRGERAVGRIEHLTTELLTLARQGDGVDEPTEFSLEAVVHDAWEVVGTADADLIVGDDTMVRGDRSRIQQVFENLFRNAVDHGSTGSRRAVAPRRRYTPPRRSP